MLWGPGHTLSPIPEQRTPERGGLGPTREGALGVTFQTRSPGDRLKWDAFGIMVLPHQELRGPWVGAGKTGSGSGTQDTRVIRVKAMQSLPLFHKV